jgi:hypothetical protein
MNQMTPIAWPVKSREMHNHHMDSTVWNSFKFRDDDVVVATYAKSGTTWTQQIVAQLIFNGAEGVEVSKLSPWIDLRIMPPEAIAGLEHQTHRRVLKTHLPVDALVVSPKAISAVTGAMRSGACSTTTSTRPTISSPPSTTAPADRGRGWSVASTTCAPFTGAGSTPTASPIGSSGRTSAPGGRSAGCRTC